MTLEKYEIQQIIDNAAYKAAMLALSMYSNPKLKEYISERRAREMLAKAKIPGAMLDTWVNTGRIQFHRSGVTKNSMKKFYHLDLDTLIKEHSPLKR